MTEVVRYVSSLLLSLGLYIISLIPTFIIILIWTEKREWNFTPKRLFILIIPLAFLEFLFVRLYLTFVMLSLVRNEHLILLYVVGVLTYFPIETLITNRYYEKRLKDSLIFSALICVSYLAMMFLSLFVRITAPITIDSCVYLLIPTELYLFVITLMSILGFLTMVVSEDFRDLEEFGKIVVSVNIIGFLIYFFYLFYLYFSVFFAFFMAFTSNFLIGLLLMRDSYKVEHKSALKLNLYLILIQLFFFLSAMGTIAIILQQVIDYYQELADINSLIGLIQRDLIRKSIIWLISLFIPFSASIFTLFYIQKKMKNKAIQ